MRRVVVKMFGAIELHKAAAQRHTSMKKKQIALKNVILEKCIPVGPSQVVVVCGFVQVGVL